MESTANVRGKRGRNADIPETAGSNKRRRSDHNEPKRWKDYQQLMQDYVELSSNIVLYPTNALGTFGYDATRGQYPIEAMSALQFIKSPVRRPTVFERWSPYEIAVFEAALGHYGKEFHRVQKEIGTKTTKEVVDFYYVWKKTTHYEGWKKQYVPPYLDVSDDDADATKS